MWRDEGRDFEGSADELIGEAMPVFDRGLQDNAVGGEVASGSIWSILRAPADGVVVLVDGLHTLTGASWYVRLCTLYSYLDMLFGNGFTVLNFVNSSGFFSMHEGLKKAVW